MFDVYQYFDSFFQVYITLFYSIQSIFFFLNNSQNKLKINK